MNQVKLIKLVSSNLGTTRENQLEKLIRKVGRVGREGQSEKGVFRSSICLHPESFLKKKKERKKERTKERKGGGKEERGKFLRVDESLERRPSS